MWYLFYLYISLYCSSSSRLYCAPYWDIKGTSQHSHQSVSWSQYADWNISLSVAFEKLWSTTAASALLAAWCSWCGSREPRRQFIGVSVMWRNAVSMCYRKLCCVTCRLANMRRLWKTFTSCWPSWRGTSLHSNLIIFSSAFRYDVCLWIIAVTSLSLRCWFCFSCYVTHTRSLHGNYSHQQNCASVPELLRSAAVYQWQL